MEQQQAKRTYSRRKVIAAGALATAMTGIGIAFPIRYANRVYPGLTVLGQDLSGLTQAEALALVRSQIIGYCEELVTFTLDDKTWVASAEEVGVMIDWDRLADAIIAHGRGGALDRISTLMPWQEDASISLPVVVDQAVMNQYLDTLGDEVFREARDATLEGAGPETKVVPEVIGREIDVEAAREVIFEAARTLTRQSVELPVIRHEPSVTAADLTPIRDRIVKITGEPITLHYQDQTWEIGTSDLTSSLVVPEDVIAEDPWIDPWWIDRLVEPIVNELWVEPKDAVVAWDGGLYSLEPSVTGRMVERQQLVDAIIAAAETDEREVDVPVTEVPPRVDSNNLGALGITGLVASGDSSFAGSSWERAENVRVASYWVSQTLIAPGEEFSFNAALGPITLDRGYVEGKIIMGDWYTSDIGGGACQVSTTVYRAALLAGLPFTEWHPHSSRVSFYEMNGWSVGFDAAIYQPESPDGWPLDLKFVNTTGAWLLLQMQIAGDWLSAQLYGAPTGWEVVLDGPTLSNPTPPPPPVERPSSELAPGERYRSQLAQEGITATVHRTVYENGTVIHSDTFTSVYAPMPEVILVGQ